MRNRIEHRRKLAMLLVLTVALAGCASGDKVDRDFDTRVRNPAYAGNGPRVLFDEAHHNVHTARKSYRPFAELIEADGYRVERGTEVLAADGLVNFDALVVAAALGDNDVNDAPAFGEAECDAVRDWVAGGGALLLLVDHFPVGDANARLASRFGLELGRGVAEDSASFDPTFDRTHIVFARENGGLGAHPIVDGRGAAETIDRILSFTGTSLRTDAPAMAFLVLGAAAYARPPQPAVERKGGDVIVRVAYGDPVAISGWSQGLAMEFGRGRVVVLGEAAMLTARLHRFDGRPIGMNTPGYDNRQLALNIMHWLTRLM
jgi:hypothetical protein